MLGHKFGHSFSAMSQCRAVDNYGTATRPRCVLVDNFSDGPMYDAQSEPSVTTHMYQMRLSLPPKYSLFAPNFSIESGTSVNRLVRRRTLLLRMT